MALYLDPMMAYHFDYVYLMDISMVYCWVLHLVLSMVIFLDLLIASHLDYH